VQQNELQLTAFCGLYCGDCIRYQCKASDLADELLSEIDNHHFTEYANVKQTHTKEFKNFNELISSLKAISGIKCETPCRIGGDGCGGSCEIIKCVKNKSLEGCWDCDDSERCDKLEFLKPFHGDGLINNLRAIKQYGLSNWAKHRDKCYPWLKTNN
jgi:uncharacterized protein DUF3795